MKILNTKLKRLMRLAAEKDEFTKSDLYRFDFKLKHHVQGLIQYDIIKRIKGTQRFEFTERFYREVSEIQQLTESIQ